MDVTCFKLCIMVAEWIMSGQVGEITLMTKPHLLCSTLLKALLLGNPVAVLNRTNLIQEDKTTPMVE